MADQITTSLAEAKVLVMQGMAGKAPRINSGGTWEVFDNSTQAWVDTGVYAHGQDAYSPYIGDNGYWYVWDDQGQEYVNTNVKAQGPQGNPGPDGVSPTVTVTSIAGGHRVTITDVTHPGGQSFDVMDTQLVATIIDGDTLYVENMALVENYDEEEF